MAALSERPYAALQRELRPGVGECPFVVRDARHEVELLHYSGGRDAEYIFVSQRRGEVVTIRYAPHVEGTTLIYDLTAGALQGKARPFACDLRETPLRVFALLPVQIEEIAVAVVQKKAEPAIQVEFRDAQGERLQAALPFCLTVEGQQPASYCTDKQGRFSLSVSAALRRVTVRSQLTGREETLVP